MRIGRASLLSRNSGFRYASGCCAITSSMYHQCYDSRFPGSAAIATTPGLDISIVIVAAPAQVLKAFFDADALGAWWQVAHSVTTPRALGPYAIEWTPTDFRDEVLGRLGGVFRGTVMQFDAGTRLFRRRLLLAAARRRSDRSDGARRSNARWPARIVASGTRLHVRQSGFEESARWRRYYEVVGQRLGARARVAAIAAGKMTVRLKPDTYAADVSGLSVRLQRTVWPTPRTDGCRARPTRHQPLAQLVGDLAPDGAAAP